MTVYDITLQEDMGHLVIDGDITKIPGHIYNFVFTQARTYLNIATDNEGRGCRFYILKSGLKNSWTYRIGSDIINIKYPSSPFNPKTMKYLPTF